MIKKSVLLTSALLLAACAAKDSPIPAEYANADYQLSDADALKWVAASEQAEKCIYPTLTRIQKEHFTKEDKYIYLQYVFIYPLEDLIGEDMVKVIEKDQKSMDFITYQRNKFKNKVEVKELDSDQCTILQKKARDDLAVLKGEHKTAMTEESKAQANSLEQSKFSFDILKWGVGLFF
ncbi:DUF5358 family protein [Pasteurellaceae bacterium LIM206]|nr:DUF5358 family protein [Pasteurellaceae bacterium LIM206]